MASRADKTDYSAAFSREALPHLDALYSAALHLTHNQDDAKDLCQEAMLHAYRSFHQFTPGTNCRAWLLTIVYNLFRNNYRRGLREQVSPTSGEFQRALERQQTATQADSADPEARQMQQTIDQEVADALEQLPEEFRSALLLVDAQELTYEEAAKVLNVPIGTIRSRLSRARALMRAALENFAIARGIKRPD
jgi:RNA polymerase sigma-70 factor (ECF subfamily)